MPRDIVVKPEPGQRVIVNPVGDGTIRSVVTAKNKLETVVTAAGTYVEPPPVITPPGAKVVPVSSVQSLLQYLDDDTVDEIVVADNTYHASSASGQAGDSLWIGSRYADRTRPIVVRAQTPGGVTFDGVGSQGGITFVEGAHHQTWDGFRFGSFRPTQTGVIVFGGYAGDAAPHHITLRNTTMLPSIAGTTPNNDHMLYFSWAVGGPHDILIEYDYTVDTPVVPKGQNGIKSALQFYHSDAANLNAWNVTVRRMHVTGTMSAILIYDPTVHDVLIEDSDIHDARDAALNVNACGANVVLRNVTSVNSHGVYYPSGKPAGLSLINCSLA